MEHQSTKFERRVVDRKVEMRYLEGCVRRWNYTTRVYIPTQGDLEWLVCCYPWKCVQKRLVAQIQLEPIDPTSAGADDSGLTDPRHKLQIPVSQQVTAVVLFGTSDVYSSNSASRDLVDSSPLHCCHVCKSVQAAQPARPRRRLPP